MPRDDDELPPLSVVALVVMHGMLASNRNQTSRESMVGEAFTTARVFLEECKRRTEAKQD